MQFVLLSLIPLLVSLCILSVAVLEDRDIRGPFRIFVSAHRRKSTMWAHG